MRMNWKREKNWKYESLKCSIEWKTGQCESRALVQYLFLINFLNCRAYQCWCDVLLLMLAKIKHKCVPPQVHWASNACTYSSPVVLLSDFSEVRCARPFTKIMMTTSTMMMMLMAIYWHSNCLSSINGASTSTGAIIVVFMLASQQ